ncbi:tape measure protein [Arthrobacter sp. fls2-241-R2A-172]|uniref:tape measure protein n=1 Tax=Arthrobacter sp. fls2-241-R2A-172 TaxID=3040325 RepID=UPI00254DC93F|nr:tape measure protein [Arthrobacter sp. fls2-241-R2A-172]
MADEVGSGQVAITPVFPGFRTKVTSEVEASGSEGGRRFSTAFGSAVKGIGSIVGKSLLAGGAIVGAIGAISIKGGISKALQIEDATAKMKGLGNNTETVSEVMSNALASVKGTAFGMGDAANVASTALASGIKPGEEMSKYLTLVADAASTAQVPLGEMGTIMGKVTNSGKVTNDVLNQFGDRGVGVLQMLAKHYGVTASEMTAMVAKGKVDAATFNKVLTENIGGAAKKSGDTTRGAFANMKSAMANFGMALVGGFLPLVKPVFNQVQLIFEGLTTRLKPFAAAWADTFQTKVGPIISNFAANFFVAMDKAIGSINAFVLAFRSGGDQITASGFTGFLQRVGAISGDVFREMRGGIRAFREAWIANDGDITSSGFPGFMEQAAFVIHQLADAFKQLDFSSVSNFFASIGPAAGQAGGAFSSIGSSLSTLGPAFVAFGEQLPKVTDAATKLASVGLNVVVGALGFLADHVDTIIAWMPAIVAGFVAWRIATTAMGASMFSLQAAQVAMAPVNLANNILRVQAIRLEMQHAAATGANTAAQSTGMFATIRATAALVAQRVATAAGVVAMGVATAAQWAWNAALNANPISLIIIAIAALVAGLVWFFTQTELGREIFSNVFNFIQSVVQNVVNWFTGTFLPGFQAVWALFLAGTLAVGQFFIDAWNNVGNGIAAFVAWAVGMFLQFNPVYLIINNWQAILGFFAGLWSAVTTGIGDFVSGAVGYFTSLPARILESLGNLRTLLLDSGKALIQGFIDGITGAAGAIGDAIGGVLEGARQFFPFSPAKKGPFSGRGYTSYSGKALAGDFAKGITSEQQKVQAAANTIMGAASLTGTTSNTSAPAGAAAAGWQGTGATVHVTMPIRDQMTPESVARAFDNQLNYKLRRERV